MHNKSQCTIQPRPLYHDLMQPTRSGIGLSLGHTGIQLLQGCEGRTRRSIVVQQTPAILHHTKHRWQSSCGILDVARNQEPLDQRSNVAGLVHTIDNSNGSQVLLRVAAWWSGESSIGPGSKHTKARACKHTSRSNRLRCVLTCTMLGSAMTLAYLQQLANL
jgi:hypothetical protein